jgi:hypothetical protein
MLRTSFAFLPYYELADYLCGVDGGVRPAQAGVPDETTEVALYALHGALVDSPWQHLPKATQMALRDAAALVGPMNA